jgi:hypothetical protein
MKNKALHHFNMIEISFALLVIAIGVTTIFGLIPIGSLSHAEAVNQNQAADAAENALNRLSADVQLNWAAMVVAQSITPDHATITHMDSDDSSGFLTATNWLHVDSGANIGAKEAGLYKYTSGSGGDLYRFIQVTTMGDNTKVVDFDGIVKVWQSTVVPQGYDSSANTGMNVVMINVEVSWPASLILEQRKRAYYKMEVFCHQCDAK